MAININVGTSKEKKSASSAIDIKVGGPREKKPGSITINVGEDIKDATQASLMMQVRRTLDGNVLIFDHKDIDIVLMPKEKKIIAMAKDMFGPQVYEAQDRLFKFLTRKGVIKFDSVQGGNIYSSMEASIAESKDYNETQIVLFTVGKFIEKERPFMEYEFAFEKKEEERLSAPDKDESTDFDPDRFHGPEKGSIRPGVKPFGIANIYRL